MDCAQCNLCCKLLTIRWTDSPAGKWCKHATPGKGCAVHSELDDWCKNFKCAYYQMPKASPDLRPDNCHVIFERVSKDIFFGTQDPDYELTKPIIKQIREFTMQGFSVVLRKGKDPWQIVPKKGTSAKDVFEEVQRLIKEIENGDLRN